MPKHSTSTHATLSFLLALLKTLRSYEEKNFVVVNLSDDNIQYDANQQTCQLSSEVCFLDIGKLVDGVHAYGTYLAEYTKDETAENAVFYQALVEHCTHIDHKQRPPSFAALQTYLELHLFVYEKINFIEKFHLQAIHFDRCDSIDSVLKHEAELKNQLKQIQKAKEWQDYRDLRILGTKLPFHAQITQTKVQIDRLFKYIEQEAQCRRSRFDHALPTHPRTIHIPSYTTHMEDKDEESSLEDEDGLRLVPVKQLGKGVYSSARLMQDKDNKKSLVVLSPNSDCVGYLSSLSLRAGPYSYEIKKKEILSQAKSAYVFDKKRFYYMKEEGENSEDHSWKSRSINRQISQEILIIFTQKKENKVFLLTEEELSKLNSTFFEQKEDRSERYWTEIHQKLYFNQITHSPEQVFFFKIEIPGFPPTYRLGIPYIHDETVDIDKFKTFLSKLKFLKALADRLAFYNNRLVIIDIKPNNMLFLNETCHFIDGGISREENEPVGPEFSHTSNKDLVSAKNVSYHLDPTIWTKNDPKDPTDPALAQFHWDIYALGSMVLMLNRNQQVCDDPFFIYTLLVDLKMRLRHQELSLRPKIDAIQTYLYLNIFIYEKLTELKKFNDSQFPFVDHETLFSVFEYLTHIKQQLSDIQNHPEWQEYLHQQSLGWEVHYVQKIKEMEFTTHKTLQIIYRHAYYRVFSGNFVAQFKQKSLESLQILAARAENFLNVNKAVYTAILSLVESLNLLVQTSFNLSYKNIFELYSMLYTFQVAASQAIQKAEKRIGGPSEYTNSLKRELIIVSNDDPAKYSFRLFKPEQEEKTSSNKIQHVITCSSTGM